MLEARVGTHVARQIEAVHARHFYIHQHHRRGHVLQLLQRIDTVLRGNELVALAREETAGDLAHGERIIHHHDDWLFGLLRRRRRRHKRCFGLAGRRLRLRTLGEDDRIEDKDDFTRAQHRGAGNAGDAGDLRTNVLDDDFLVADQFVHLDRHHVDAAAKE